VIQRGNTEEPTSSIQWAVDKFNTRNKPRERDPAGAYADRTIKKCPICNKGWEKVYDNGKQSYEVYDYYIGLFKEKQICPICAIHNNKEK